MTTEKTMAVCGLICGLICGACPIFLVHNNSEIAQKLAEDFKGRWENVKADFKI